MVDVAIKIYYLMCQVRCISILPEQPNSRNPVSCVSKTKAFHHPPVSVPASRSPRGTSTPGVPPPIPVGQTSRWRRGWRATRNQVAQPPMSQTITIKGQPLSSRLPRGAFWEL